MGHDLLIKFGQENHMKRLYALGELYMNTLASYRGDAVEFVTRVKNEAIRRGLSHWRSSVEYMDMSTRHGEVGPFVKDLAFSHQQELRIAVFVGAREPGPITLRIGETTDIACLVPASDVGEITLQSLVY